MKFLKILSIILLNGILFFGLCVGSFMIYAFLQDGTVGQGSGMILSPLLVVMFVSALASAVHGVIYGLAIGLVGDRLTNNPVVSAISLGLSWLFILMAAGWLTSSGDGGGEAPWIYLALNLVSIACNLSTIFIAKKAGTNPANVFNPR